MRRTRWCRLLRLAGLAVLVPTTVYAADSAHFVVDGRLVAFDGAAAAPVALRAAPGSAAPTDKIERAWGALPDGRVIAVSYTHLTLPTIYSV